MKQTLGILGGLGPLASAEFLKTIYEFNITDLEQKSPICILFSDPTFPERTEVILRGLDDVIINMLVKSLESLCHLGVSKIVISCVTMHYFLPKVQVSLREKIISLIDVIVVEILNTEKRSLLLCTNVARQAGIFQKHEDWNLIKEYVLFPDDEDQKKIHYWINNELKINGSKHSSTDYFDTLVGKYKADALIAGCTELHIINKYLMQLESEVQYQVVDPLITIAKNLNYFMDA